MSNGSSRLSRTAFGRLAPAVVSGLLSLDQAVADSGLDPGLLELVRLRASQLNGCAYCIQFHLTAARTHQVPRDKLDLVVAWQDAAIFTEKERAALAWTEALTDIGLGVSDDDYDDVREQFSEAQLAHLSAAIATVNAWNRISVGFRFAPQPPGPRAVET